MKIKLLFLSLIFSFNAWCLALDTDTALFSYKKEKWYYQNYLCDTVKDIYFKNGPFEGTVSLSLYFKKGVLDSIVSFRYARLPGCFSTLSVYSTETYKLKDMKRFYRTFSCGKKTSHIQSFSIVSNHTINSIKSIYDMLLHQQVIADGVCAEFYESGQILSIGYYKLGNRVGTWYYYDFNGVKQKTERYKNNVLVSSVSH
jgi:antitoxin component YwqK of YwqJK toxin-antitoxin module